MLGYAVGDHNFEQANTEAARTPLQKHYAEDVPREGGVSPRCSSVTGIGRVLGVSSELPASVLSQLGRAVPAEATQGSGDGVGHHLYG